MKLHETSTKTMNHQMPRKDKVNTNLALSVHYFIYQLTHKSMTLHRLATFAAIKIMDMNNPKNTQKNPTSM